jgi:GT2 family glycosyltransferase
MSTAADVDVLIPTCSRPAALAVTLTCLFAQTYPSFRTVVSDQTEESDAADVAEVRAVVRAIESHGPAVEILKHLPRRGMAEQRQFLLDQARAPYALFIDDDLILEPDLIERMVAALEEQDCGFVGSALIGLSFKDDVRPHEQAVEFWEGRVEPEVVRPELVSWQRHKLHNAANILHLQQRLGITRSNPRLYRVAWVGGCVLYDTARLREAGGFSFWTELPPEHCGEDVLAQLRVMERYGGCGLLPSGAYHQELPTTIPDRRVNAPVVLS